MRRLAALALLSIWLALPSTVWALADTCTCSAGTCNWTALGTYAGCTVACVGGDNNAIIDTDDTIVFSGTCAMTIPNGTTITMGTAVGLGLNVQTGASFTIANGATFQVGVDGLDCDDGSTCIGNGQVLEFGPAAPTFSLDSPSTAAGSYSTLGEIVVCPADDGAGNIEEDCEQDNLAPGSRAQAAFCWPDVIYNVVGDGNEGEQFVDIWYDQLQVGNVLVFFDPTEGTRPPADRNSPYEIVDVATFASENCAVVDVRQGANNQAGYTLIRRDFADATIQTAAAAGARTLTVASTAIAANDEAKARYITCVKTNERFAEGTNGWSAGIIDSTDGGGGNDTLVLDPGGARESVSATDECFITYGWRRGDPLFAMEVAELHSSTATDDDSTFLCDGTCQFRNSLIQEIEGIVWDDPEGFLFENVWARDIDGGSGLSTEFHDLVGSQITRYMQTGGDASADTTHGLHADNWTNIDVVDAHIRHAGDDPFIFDNPNVSVGTGFIRYRVSFTSGTGGSVNNIAQAAVVDSGYTVLDALYEASTVQGSAGEMMQCNTAATGVSCFARNVVTIGNDNSFATGSRLFPVVNLYSIGDVVGPDPAAGVFLGSSIYGATIRDLDLLGTSNGVIGALGRMEDTVVLSAETTNATNGSFWPMPTAANSEFINSAIWNPILATTTASDGVLECTGAIGAGVVPLYQRFLIGWAPGTLADQVDRGVQLGCGDSMSQIEFDGLMVVYFQDGVDVDIDATAIRGATQARQDSIQWSNGPCFFGNTLDTASSGFDDDFNQGVVQRSKELGLVDPANERFDVADSSLGNSISCGVTRNAGVVEQVGTRMRGIYPRHDPWLKAAEDDEDRFCGPVPCRNKAPFCGPGACIR